MNRHAVITMLLACGGAPPAQDSTAPTLQHNEELNAIMKTEVNEAFSALQFLVFHSDGELDFGRIAVPASTLRGGIAKVRSIADPPVKSSEARSVFFTYVDSLEHDTESFNIALARHDRGRMESLLTKISKTCNNCHHFFRLSITDSPDK
jgi:hypothetical protein